MARQIIAHSQDCQDGKCAAFMYDDETGDYHVRGYLPDGTEADVRIPARDWPFMVAQLPR